MIERLFWEEVQKAWIIQAPPEIIDVKTGSGGNIDPGLLAEPWEMEDIEFENVKTDNGGSKQAVYNKPVFDAERFDVLIERKNLPDYIDAAKMLREFGLPASMECIYEELIEKMTALQEVISKYESIYSPDMSRFYEYYIPETLQLTSTYIEYQSVGIVEDILNETEGEVLDACRKLILAINEKNEEIIKYASIEIKATAKTLGRMINQAGYGDDYKIK